MYNSGERIVISGAIHLGEQQGGEDGAGAFQPFVQRLLFAHLDAPGLLGLRDLYVIDSEETRGNIKRLKQLEEQRT